jgi:hypothetical protein
VAVTLAPPDVTVDTVDENRLNLYLYHIRADASLKNQEIPGQGYPGAYGHPPLSLELYYLMTAFAAPENVPTADEVAQEILGDAMRVLHDFAIVTQALTITRTTAGTVGDVILDTDLRGEFERMKITFQPMSLDDSSKIWTALPQANFRRSVAYEVSVVQIESQRRRRYPRLVGEPAPHVVGPPPVTPSTGPMIYVEPFRHPQIHEVLLRRAGDPPDTDMERSIPYACIRDTLILRGRNFTSDLTTRVRLGNVVVTTPLWRDDRIEVEIPDNPALQPGPQTVMVTLDVRMGQPPTPHIGYRSNVGIFMLLPHVTGADIPTTGIVRIQGTRLFDEGLECLTLVGNEVVPSANYTTSTTTEIRFNQPSGLASGSYLVRVRVNGAESLDNVILTVP